MTKFLILLLFWSNVGVLQAKKEEKDWTKLVLSTGAIRGRKLVTARNNTAYLFHGIPYAEPPIGDLRFRAPIDKKEWKGELKADDYQAICMSTKIVDITQPNPRRMSEDCLHANVFTTEKCLWERNCPVMYYVHGGIWNYGSPFDFPDWLLVDNFQSKDIVLVTVTFRHGFFGFMNTGKRTSAAKNLALLDIILGLQWTQREIGKFGGDKNQVSIMGHSSGASSVNMLSLSPKTDGLFRQVIIMSGPQLSLRTDTNVAVTKAIAMDSGCATEELWNDGDSFEIILKCLRSKSADELIKIMRKLEKELSSGQRSDIVVDLLPGNPLAGQLFLGSARDGEDGVLPGTIEALLAKRRPYSMLTGTTNREYRVAKQLILDEKGNANRTQLNIACVMLAKYRGFKHPVAVGQACTESYMKRPFDIADLVDDILIHVPTYDSSEAVRQKGATVYKYSFEYSQIGDAFGKGKKNSFMESPFHAEDLVYVMGLGYGTFTTKDDQIAQIYSGMFANFILTGDPSPSHNDKWQPTDDRNNYFKIDFDADMKMPGNTDGYHAGAVQFWTKIAPEIDQFQSKSDINDTFSFKRLAQDLIGDLKEKGMYVDQDMENEIAQWKDDLQGMNQEQINRVEQVLNDLWQQTAAGEHEHERDNSQRIEQMKQIVRHILPSVLEETNVSEKDIDWRTWFWVVAGVCAFLAIILLLTCCRTCYQYLKRRQYERLHETISLNPSSVNTYG